MKLWELYLARCLRIKLLQMNLKTLRLVTGKIESDDSIYKKGCRKSKMEEIIKFMNNQTTLNNSNSIRSQKNLNQIMKKPHLSPQLRDSIKSFPPFRMPNKTMKRNNLTLICKKGGCVQ